jgi:hypothetical protein
MVSKQKAGRLVPGTGWALEFFGAVAMGWGFLSVELRFVARGFRK